MAIEELEINWRAGATVHTLFVGPDGAPQVRSSAAPDGDVAAPREARRPAGPARRGQAWTEEEEERLKEAFAAGVTPEAVGAELGRSRGAVKARLVLLGLLTEEEAGLRYPVRKEGASG